MTRIERTQRVLKAFRGRPQEFEMITGLLEADWVIAGVFSEELFDQGLLTQRLDELMNDMAAVLAPQEAS